MPAEPPPNLTVEEIVRREAAIQRVIAAARAVEQYLAAHGTIARTRDLHAALHAALHDLDALPERRTEARDA